MQIIPHLFTLLPNVPRRVRDSLNHPEFFPVRRGRLFCRLLAIAFATLSCAWTTLVVGQQPPATAPQAAPKAAPAAGAQPQGLKPKTEELPPARELTLQTKPTGNFGPVDLACTWFAGTHKQETVPVILLHSWGSNRQRLLPLAQHLQQELGCAVLVPDLRGHGESKSQVGVNKKLEASQFNKHEIPLANEDLEACKRFLKERHEAGDLNLEMLTVIACGQTTALAASWTAADWQWPPYQGVKQGQDVKLLVLLSPVRKFEAINFSTLIKTPLFSEPKFNGVTTVLFWDSLDDTSEREAAALEAVLVKGHGPVPAPDSPERWAQLRYSLKVVKRGGVGEEMLAGPTGELVTNEITSLIEQKLASRAKQYPWVSRGEK